jgi:hypothetical protein
VTLDEARASIGRKVLYRAMTWEEDAGVITSVNDAYVFVRYGTGIEATRPEDLHLGERRPVTP